MKLSRFSVESGGGAPARPTSDGATSMAVQKMAQLFN